MGSWRNLAIGERLRNNEGLELLGGRVREWLWDHQRADVDPSVERVMAATASELGRTTFGSTVRQKTKVTQVPKYFTSLAGPDSRRNGPAMKYSKSMAAVRCRPSPTVSITAGWLPT